MSTKKCRFIPHLRYRSERGLLGGKLKLRYWAYSNDTFDGDKDIKIFVGYTAKPLTDSVEKSYSMQKGLVGVVKAHTGRDQAVQNHLVIIHELLHCLGATDKYDPRTLQPIFPDGYGNPHKTPRYPQESAEIMAGRIAYSDTGSLPPKSLHDVVIGNQTAREIHWISD